MTERDLPDVNVLVALLHAGHVHHRAAQDWFASVARFVTTPVTEAGVIRVAMNPAVMGAQASAGDALESLRSLRRDPRAEFLPDDATLTEPTIDLVGLVGFRQVTDLHLVNLAAAHAARVVTFDTKIRPVLPPDDAALVRVLS